MGSRDRLSNELVTFVTRYISSISQLEVLLLLFHHPDRDWSAEDVDQNLKSSLEFSISILRELAASSLLIVEPNGKYRYSPKTPELSQGVEELAKAYPLFRLRISDLIYSKPKATIEAFADAFKLKPDGKS